jgi:hypothetical protein
VDTNETIALLIDESAGIYIPRNFYEHYDFLAWELNIDDYQDLAMPENEGYWETWENLLVAAWFRDSNGHVWTLLHDRSLFAVRDNHVFEYGG